MLTDSMGVAVLVDELVPRNGKDVVFEKEWKHMFDAVQDAYEGEAKKRAQDNPKVRVERGARNEFGLVPDLLQAARFIVAQRCSFSGIMKPGSSYVVHQAVKLYHIIDALLDQMKQFDTPPSSKPVSVNRKDCFQVEEKC